MKHLPYLSKQESAVYQASLELGPDTTAHIAKKALLPRSSVYLIIDDLKDKGLLSETKRDKKTLIIPESPQKLLSYLEDKKQDMSQDIRALKSTLPELNALFNARTDKPLISFYEGFEGVKTIFEQTLSANEILVLCSGYKKHMDKRFASYLTKTYFPEIDRRNIVTREIIGPSPDADEYITSYGSKLHTIKKTDKQYNKQHIDKLFYEHTVAIVSYDTLNGTVITHKSIADFERKLFYQLWESMK